MGDNIDITQTQQNILYGFIGFVALITSTVFILAVRNLVSIYRLKIKKLLIILLYVACIGREILMIVEVAFVCIYPFQETPKHVRLVYAASALFSVAMEVIVILTNYSLYNSMRMIRGMISSKQRKTRDIVSRVIGLLYCIALSVIHYPEDHW